MVTRHFKISFQDIPNGMKALNLLKIRNSCYAQNESPGVIGVWPWLVRMIFEKSAIREEILLQEFLRRADNLA